MLLPTRWLNKVLRVIYNITKHSASGHCCLGTRSVEISRLFKTHFVSGSIFETEPHAYFFEGQWNPCVPDSILRTCHCVSMRNLALLRPRYLLHIATIAGHSTCTFVTLPIRRLWFLVFMCQFFAFFELFCHRKKL